MSTATIRQLQEAPDLPPRTNHSHQDLLVIPANPTPATSHNMDIRTIQNWLNRRPDGWNSPQSPDELVIQKRGRRRPIIWSPDLDTYKRRSLLSLSSRDCTPVKSPPMSNMALRDAAKKRLSLTDTRKFELSTSESKRSRLSLDVTNTSRKQNDNNLMNSLRGLSQEQLVVLIMELVYAQEDGALCQNEKLRSILLKKMPAADIQPLIKKLAVLRQNIYASLVFFSDLNNDSTYSRAYIHLDMFQLQKFGQCFTKFVEFNHFNLKKVLIDQGKILQESQHWASLMRYVLEAWRITRELPEWENQGHHNITHKCFKSLSQFCMEAIRKGNFCTSVLKVYIESLKTIVGECEDFKICLQVAKEAEHEV